MGLSSFNAMRARERAILQAQAENIVGEEKTAMEEIPATESKVEKKKTDAEKLKKKG